MIIKICTASAFPKRGMAALAASAAVALAIAAGLATAQQDWDEAFPDMLGAWPAWGGAAYVPLPEYAFAQYTFDPSAQSAPPTLTLTPVAGVFNDLGYQKGTRTLAIFESDGGIYAAITSSFRSPDVKILNLTRLNDLSVVDSIVDTGNIYLGGAPVVAPFESDGGIYAAIASPNDDGVQILNLTHPNGISASSSITYGALYIDGASDIAPFESDGHPYAAVVSEYDDRVQVLDLTDPNDISAAGGIADDNLYLDDVLSIATFESGDRTYAAAASLSDGVQILDLTDPYNISAAGGISDDDNLELGGVSHMAVFESGANTYAAAASKHDGGGVQILDLTDPYNISAAGGISDDDNLELGGVSHIAVFESGANTYAAAASKHDGGVQILDLTDPYNISAAGGISDDDSLHLREAMSIAIFESDGRTYAATASRFDGIQILDLTDPYNISAAGGIHHADILGYGRVTHINTFESDGRTYATVASSSTHGVRILDLTDPYDVTPVGGIADDYGVYLYSATIDIFESGGRTYAAAASYYDRGVQILDLTDPYNVTAADGISDDDNLYLLRPHRITTFESDGKTYAAATSHAEDGVQILDLTDPYNVTAADGISDDDGIQLRGASSVDTFESDGRTYAAAAARFDGVQILDLTDPYNVTAADGIPDTDLDRSDVRHVSVFESGDRTYAAVMSSLSSTYAIRILDLTDPYNVTAAGYTEGNGMPTGVFTFEFDGRTYAAVTFSHRIHVLDLTDPHNISAAGGITDPFGALFYDANGIDAFELDGSTYLAVTSSHHDVWIVRLAAVHAKTCVVDAADADDAAIPPEIAASTNRFAVDFYRQISGETGNVFFSPVSVYAAFSMVGEAARGETAAQLRHAFGFDPDAGSRHDDMAALAASLNRPDPCATLQTASSLWLAERFEPYASYVDVVDGVYSGHIETVDFTDGGVGRINDWAAEKTNGTIPKVLDRDMVGENTAFAVLNAIYFKGSWGEPFPEGATHESDFWTGAQNVTADFMEIETNFDYTHSDGVQVLRMPYQGDRLSMLVVLPTDRDGLERLENTISTELLDEWREGLYPTLVQALVPKFEVSTHYNLTSPLASMGVVDVFDKKTSDLSGMAHLQPDERLYVEFAIQDAYVKVNEEGTEAAAVTSVGGLRQPSLPPQPVLFVADHPFLFLIQDDESGTVLFLGRISDPLAGG